MPLPLFPQGTLDFTGIVREDVLVRLQRNANQVNPEWDDFSAAFPENLLLEGMAFVADLIRGTMEERTRQLNWATITDRLAAIRLGRISGFILTGGLSATVTGTFTIIGGGTHGQNIIIPIGTRVRTNDPTDPKKYRTTQAVTITTGSKFVDVPCEQAEEVIETVESTNEPNLEFLLGETPYIDDSAIVTAADGAYTQFDTFLGATSTTKAFVVLVDDQGRGRIRFGNGINGAIPQGNINVVYKIGGGVAGEIESGASWTIEDSINDVLVQPVSLIFTNATSSQPAADAMTVAEARVRGPLSTQVMDAVVHETQFEIVATNVPGVARAFMATSNNSTDVGEDRGRLEIIAFGEELASGRFAPATPTQSTLDLIAAKFEQTGDYPSVMGVVIEVVAATYTDANIVVRIYKDSSYTQADVSENIRNSLKDFFAVALRDKTPNPAIDFGARLLGSDGLPDYTIAWSDIFNAINDTDGVRQIPPQTNNLLINGLQSNLFLLPRKFPRIGAITILDMDAGGVQI